MHQATDVEVEVWTRSISVGREFSCKTKESEVWCVLEEQPKVRNTISLRRKITFCGDIVRPPGGLEELC